MNLHQVGMCFCAEPILYSCSLFSYYLCWQPNHQNVHHSLFHSPCRVYHKPLIHWILTILESSSCHIYPPSLKSSSLTNLVRISSRKSCDCTPLHWWVKMKGIRWKYADILRSKLIKTPRQAAVSLRSLYLMITIFSIYFSSNQ